MEELRDKLLDWAKQFETPDFIKDDPIFFPHKYNDKKDIEISAFLTSWIAFGNRKLIMQQAEILDNLMGNIRNGMIWKYFMRVTTMLSVKYKQILVA